MAPTLTGVGRWTARCSPSPSPRRWTEDSAPPADAFAVIGGKDTARTVDEVSLSGSAVELTLASARGGGRDGDGGLHGAGGCAEAAPHQGHFGQCRGRVHGRGGDQRDGGSPTRRRRAFPRNFRHGARSARTLSDVRGRRLRTRTVSTTRPSPGSGLPMTGRPTARSRARSNATYDGGAGRGRPDAQGAGDLHRRQAGNGGDA